MKWHPGGIVATLGCFAAAHGERIEGRLDGAGESSMVITSKGATAVLKHDAVRVYRQHDRRRTRALIGALAGAGAGGPAIAITVTGSAGIGAAVGALSGSGNETIYRRAH